MLTLYKYALGPILLAQASWLRRTALRLPEANGPRQGSEGADDGSTAPLRILVVGDSSAAGVGVDEQEHALAQPVARLLACATGRRVEWQLIAKSGVNTDEALKLSMCSTIGPADYLVTALGTNDVTSQRKPGQFIRDYIALADHLGLRTGAAGIVVTGLPPLRILPAAPHPLRWYLGRYAIRLDRALRRWVDRHPARRYVSLEWAANPAEMAIDRYHPGPNQYRRWAELVTEKILALISETRPPVHAGK
ncbi:SGNH/GDSL hydrolase family protein [Burkholderia stagnalis]|uniref:SGNH/GDSL hydrolase family protein n=1 Tax=Burkholderia stagnalis TaxID=1503054 RepID=UPI000752E863|nr:SGNH/GDSL hydrolase family protein [Burkholderia stagnalis]KVM82326.1 lysophospholipase [Burkholderia stagnalis]